MGITLSAAELSNTKLYAGDATRGGKYVHVMAYQYKAAAPGPNDLALPSPSFTITSMATSRAKSAPRKSTAKPADSTDLPQRVEAATRRIAAWLEAHVPKEFEQLRPPVQAKSLAALTKTLGRPIPPELVTMWQVHDGFPIFEYSGLGAEEAKRRYSGLEKLRKKGTFKDHEVFDQTSPRIQPVKWHSAWIPLAQDGCGNLYCLDLDPGTAGRMGQIIKWEMAGGPFAESSVDLATVLERYAAALESGQFKYDVDSGTYDGPFVDLLASKFTAPRKKNDKKWGSLSQ